jgi:hypothetical protein
VERLNFDVPIEDQAEVHALLLRFGASAGLPECSLVVRDEDDLDQSARRVLFDLLPFLVSSGPASEWPGTQLIGHTATVMKYAFETRMAEVMIESAATLYDWEEPRMPEDPCLLRQDGSPWLTTIAHERIAYLTLSPEERLALLATIPQLAPLHPWPL